MLSVMRSAWVGVGVSLSVVLHAHFALASPAAIARLRGGSGHQGSDLNAKDPTGIWSTFQRVGNDNTGAVGSGLRTVCNVWGQAACRRRSQSDVTLRLSASPDIAGAEVFAMCKGTSFCSKKDEGHHLLCQCEPGLDITPVRIALKSSPDGNTMLKGSGILKPGQYQIKFHTDGGDEEELKGLFGVEEFRPFTIFSEPKKDAVLLMSDIDGTLIGDQDATDKFFWIWNEQYRPRGAHLVYNTGRPFPSAHNLIKDNRLNPPTALVCSEGTEIYWFGPNGAEDVEPDHEWREILMLSWEYDMIKEGVLRIVEQMRHDVNDYQFLPELNGQPMIVINVPDKGKADNIIGKINHELRNSQQLKFDMTSSSGGGNFFILIIPQVRARSLTSTLHVVQLLVCMHTCVRCCLSPSSVAMSSSALGCQSIAHHANTPTSRDDLSAEMPAGSACIVLTNNASPHEQHMHCAHEQRKGKT
jgi:hypothetical protein